MIHLMLRPSAVALLLSATLAACGGGVQSSPQSAEFNAALKRCDRLSESDRRDSCMRSVMTGYSRSASGN